MASDCKESVCNAGDLGLISGLGRFPGEGNSNPLQYSCLENPMVEELGAGYRPWGRKESGMTERLHFHFHILFTALFKHIKCNKTFLRQMGNLNMDQYYILKTHLLKMETEVFMDKIRLQNC